MSHTIFVVDDDAAVRRSLVRMLNQHQFQVEEFDGAEAFLTNVTRERTGHLVLDIAMRGMSGTELVARMAEEEWHLPIVLVTGNVELAESLSLDYRGAINVLEKPYRRQDLLAILEAQR